ncbi:MAG: thioredoxin family protein [Nonlabens sp.]
MEITQIIQEALNNSMPYSQYRALMESHVLNKTNTGNEITEALANYTMLNNQRMKRLDKKLELQPETLDFLSNYHGKVRFLVITESWCGDAAQTMPMIHKIAEAGGIDLRIVLRDENEALMNEFLTNGNKAIAKLIIIDPETNKPLNSWGPRPTGATQLVQKEKKEKGTLSPEFKQELQGWYNKDKGRGTEKDLIKLLEDI